VLGGADVVVEGRELEGNEMQGVDWVENGMGDGEGGMGGGHDLWTFMDDMGWWASPGSYFLEEGSSPNGLSFGDCWTQGLVA